jgi:hypothetical protein
MALRDADEVVADIMASSRAHTQDIWLHFYYD